MITEDYVSYEVAKLLKEKGFDGVCRYYYPNGYTNLVSYVDCRRHDMFNNESCIAPTLQMACKWLEIKNHIAIIPVLSSILDDEQFLWDVKIVIAETGERYSQGWVYENREQACEAALKYILENLI